MGEYFYTDLCPCGWHYTPSFGSKFFSDTEFPVCPNCGKECWERAMTTVRYVSLPKKNWWNTPKRKLEIKNEAK